MTAIDPVPPTAAEASAADAFQHQPWIEAFRAIARHYRLPAPGEDIRLAAQWQDADNEDERIAALARKTGLQLRFQAIDKTRISPAHLPLIVQFADGALGLVTGIDAAGEVSVAMVGEAGLETRMRADMLVASAARCIIARPIAAMRDARVDAYIRPYEEHWLRRILFTDIRSYANVLIASLAANTLALAGILFSMQVYDRVIPAESFQTLYILFGGVLLAIGFEFLFRRLRMRIIDVLGKRADMRMSDQVFGHALRVRTRERPSSTGTFIAQLRDLEQVRELLTSTTVAAVADIPFFLLFFAIFWSIAGALALVPAAALILLFVPGLLAQKRLRAYAQQAMRESSLRNAMLVEAVQGIEDIKVLQAEHRFQQQWNHYNATTAESQLKLRELTTSLTVWAQNVQNGVYATIILVGAPLVMAGEITTGVLVGASILGSRMIAPVAQISTLLTRLQHAKVGIGSLNQIMALPVDNPDDEHRLQVPAITGDLTFRAAVFRYTDANSPPALTVSDLHIEAGEKIAILGRNGAGKSTFLQACSGLLIPVSGEVACDGLPLHQIDPADVRRDIGLLSQNSRLFHGTIRDNLTLGRAQATDEEILKALEVAGAQDVIRRSTAGLEHMVLEGGRGLSGGQVQGLLLARLLIREPRVALLDEPTAAMDEAAENQFIERFRTWSRNRTVLIATHRTRVLELVDRIIVIHNGRIALDDRKAAALRTMQQRGQAA